MLICPFLSRGRPRQTRIAGLLRIGGARWAAGDRYRWLTRAGTIPLSFKYFAVGKERTHTTLSYNNARVYTSAMHSLLNRLCARANYLHTVELYVYSIGIAAPILSMVQCPPNLASEPTCPLLEGLRIVTELGYENESNPNLELSRAEPHRRKTEPRCVARKLQLSKTF